MASIPPEERARIIANNKSLRIIKNEMDQLLERGGITDDQYGNFIDLLPAEASLRNASTPIPTKATNTSLPNLSSMSLLDRQPSQTPTPAVENPPPAYANATPPPPPTPRNDETPELCRVVALYRYADADPRDCDFEVGDQISVISYANNEWWSGKNLRTNQIGIFPRNYVRVEPNPTSFYGNEKGQGNYYNSSGQTQQYNSQNGNGNGNPYNSSVPPMAVANESDQQQVAAAEPAKQGKVGEMGKKFGKKLGNAAIFGAGATMGADLVNSIF